jgi:hypothetical protein
MELCGCLPAANNIRKRRHGSSRAISGDADHYRLYSIWLPEPLISYASGKLSRKWRFHLALPLD